MAKYNTASVDISDSWESMSVPPSIRFSEASPTRVMVTYIKEERVVDRERQLYVSEVPRAVVKALHAGGANFFGVGRPKRKVVQAIRRRVSNIVQKSRVSYRLHTQLPKTRRKT